MLLLRLSDLEGRFEKQGESHFNWLSELQARIEGLEQTVGVGPGSQPKPSATLAPGHAQDFAAVELRAVPTLEPVHLERLAGAIDRLAAASAGGTEEVLRRLDQLAPQSSGSGSNAKPAAAPAPTRRRR